MSFAESGFAQFIASGKGRILRIAVGLGLIGWGLLAGHFILVGLGLIPLAAGLFDLCLLAPLLGGPIKGAAIRAAGRPGNGSGS